MNKQILYYGKDEPLPERVPLRAGPLALVFENGDLRYVRLGAQLILLRAYWAVRDRNWGTVTNAISNVQIAAQADRRALGDVVIGCDEKPVPERRLRHFQGPLLHCVLWGCAATPPCPALRLAAAGCKKQVL